MDPIDFYFWPTPNGQKVSIFLEEAGIPYKLIPVDTRRGDQFDPAYLKLNPNNKIPTIVDHQNGQPLAIFESGAILLYLANKTRKFIPEANTPAYWEVVQWLMWQMGGAGPMLGQAHHFRAYAKETIPYAVERYTREANRLYGVLDHRLADRKYIVDDYSIADMAIWPWVVPRKLQGVDLTDYPNVALWHATMKARPGVQRGFGLMRSAETTHVGGDAWDTLFGKRQFSGGAGHGGSKK